MNDVRSGYYMSQRLRLHYSEWGDPAAPPLILQHGGRDHGRSWDHVVAALLPDWRIIAPDLRGHGDSAWSPDAAYAMDDYVFDHAMLFEALGIERATVIGHSLGGNIATRHAAIRPDRVEKLVSIEGLGPSPDALAKEAAKPVAERYAKWIDGRSRALVRQRRVYPSIDEAVARLAKVHPHVAPERVRQLAVDGSERVDGGWCFKADPALDAIQPTDISPAERQALWQAIACETLLIYGVDSWASNPAIDGRAAHFHHARVAMVEKGGHWLHHDQPAHFIALLREFL
ncbi:MAG: Pimeloyl-ACP methyl ester carboxylesterase [Rhizorhabdus sp.]|nr:Pimeloyl-ACP methyl ester carboxylesterase [Rhizorhabdus sp.]